MYSLQFEQTPALSQGELTLAADANGETEILFARPSPPPPPVLSVGGTQSTMQSMARRRLSTPGWASSIPAARRWWAPQWMIARGFSTGDQLNFTNQNGITGSYNASTGALTLTGTASVATYQAALEFDHLQFACERCDEFVQGLDAHDRLASDRRSDGVQHRRQHRRSYISSRPVGRRKYRPLHHRRIDDYDRYQPRRRRYQQRYTHRRKVDVSGGFTAGDSLNFTNQNGISGNYDSSTGELTLTGNASLADYQTALDCDHL